MSNETKHKDQFGENSDATKGGGASADRSGRDAGMPGPARDVVSGERGPRENWPEIDDEADEAPGNQPAARNDPS
ncbi:hypothetical protein [Singulisphaera sp. PoT]|uniref:hypothetical protein n=1 Tax=Singulisphaera sp. PoT TaxID=3411797 RepID=UPI003BF5CFFC